VANALKPDSFESGFFFVYVPGAVPSQGRFHSGVMFPRGLTCHAARSIICK
jgi:hypothetical protein